MVVRKIIRKKKKNETEDALSKVMGTKELEVAAVILKELADRKARQSKIEDKEKKLIKKPLRKPKKTESDANSENDKIKRLKELAELNKMGILSTPEFEKLKADLIN